MFATAGQEFLPCFGQLSIVAPDPAAFSFPDAATFAETRAINFVTTGSDNALSENESSCFTPVSP